VRVLVVDASGTLDVSGRLTLTQIEPAGSTEAVRLAFSATYCALLDSVCV